MREKRTLRRRALTYQLEVLDIESGDSLGRLVDISAEGMLLVGPRPAEVGERHAARMALPEAILGRGHVDLSVEAVWSRPDAGPGLFLSGYRITDAQAGDLRAIVGLIARHLLPS